MPLRMMMLALSCALLLPAPPGRTAESLEGCTGFITTLPAVVDTQGVWCLRGDVNTAMTSGSAISIQANNATIECNGFKVGGMAAGPSSNAYGISASGRQNITIRNCAIRGFREGIHLQGLGGSGHLIEDNRLDNNLVKGILVEGDGNLVRRNRVYDTGGYLDGAAGTTYGIDAQGDVVDNLVSGVFTDAANGYVRAIWIESEGAEARNNQVRGLLPTGTGNAAALQSNRRGIRISGNHVYGPAEGTVGYGIAAGGLETFCLDNSSTGFTTNFTGCEYASGNLSPP